MSDQNNQLDKFIKAKLHDLDRATPPPDWERMEYKLTGYYAGKQRIRRLKVMEVSLLLLLLLTIIQYKDLLVPSSGDHHLAREFSTYPLPENPDIRLLPTIPATTPQSGSRQTALSEMQPNIATSAISDHSGHTEPARSNGLHHNTLQTFPVSYAQTPVTSSSLIKNTDILTPAVPDIALGHFPGNYSAAFLAGLPLPENAVSYKYPWALLEKLEMNVTNNEEGNRLKGQPHPDNVRSSGSFFRDIYLLAETGNARMKSFSRTVNHHRFSRASSNVAYTLGAGTQFNDHWHMWARVRYMNGSFMPNSEFDNGIGYDHSGNMHTYFDSAGVNMLSLSVHMLPLLAASDRASWFFLIGASGHAITHARYRRQMLATNKPDDANEPIPAAASNDDFGLLEGGSLKANLFPSIDIGTVISYSIAPSVTIYLNPMLFYPLDGIGQGHDMVFVTQWMIGARLHIR